MIERISCHELSNYSLKDLFQFSKSSESSEPSELIDDLVEEPSQLPMDTNDTPQVNDPSTNQILTNPVSFNSQGTIESVHSPLGDSASEYS